MLLVSVFDAFIKHKFTCIIEGLKGEKGEIGRTGERGSAGYSGPKGERGKWLFLFIGVSMVALL